MSEKVMNIGDYVRTKSGYILKIVNINEFREPSMKYGLETSYVKDIVFMGDKDIIKSSSNIIDLIEVGDVILYKDNSIVKILEIDNKLNPPYYLIKDYCDEFWETQEWVFDGIKSVITHEQIEQMEYKL